MLANELGSRGVSCLLVDPKPGTAFNPQANATQARTMEHFRRLGFADEIRQLGLPADHPTDIAYLTRFTGFELARLRLPTAAQAPNAIKSMSGSWSAAELPHRVSQKFVEVCLHKHAQKHASVQMRYSWRLESFEDTGESVHARVQSVDGNESLFVEASFLIGADGARSFVRSQLGISWGGATGFKRRFMGGKMLAVYLKAPDFYARNPNDRAWMYVVVNPHLRGFVMSVDGVSEFAFHIQMQDDAATEALSADDARRLFAQAFGADIEIDILSMATWLAGHALVANSFGEGRVFLGGDAAHLFTPTGGLGYNTAVEDAVNLAWKLASVVRGVAPLSLLKSYELERRPLATRNTTYARQFADSIGLFEAAPELEDAGELGEKARAAASEYLNGHVRREFNIPGVTFGGRYDESPIIWRDNTTPPPDSANTYIPCASPGGRPPHAWLGDGRSLFDTFHKEWTLLVLGSECAGFEEIERAAKLMQLDLMVVHQSSPEILALYEAPLVLIRPDQIVAWRGTSAPSPQMAKDILAKVTGFEPVPV
jgi:2-polyprenyl-6-methoxyphenol hydroxylase-like FAD-dependent oxidoreductase